MRSLIAGALAALCAGGCVSLDAARALSSAGSQAANAADASLASVDPVLTSYYEREAVLAAITNGAAATPPTDELRTQIERLRDNLAKRRQLMRSLATVYEAFGALAAYDASARYGAALTELDGSIDAFAQALGQQAPDLSNEGARANTVLGWFANWQRSRVLVSNSPALGARAEQVAALLRVERDVYASLFNERTLQGRELTLALWDAGFLSARNLFVDQQLAPGFALVEDGEAFTSANEDAGMVVRALAEIRARTEVQRFRDQLDANIRVLESLSAEHERFEATQAVDLEEVMALIAQLRALGGG